MKFMKFIVFGLAAALLGFFWSCDKSDDDPEPTPTEQEDNASGAVSSDESGTITTPAGARIVVPVGAVPVTDDGGVGTIAFSIEKNNSAAISVPNGETRISDVYIFGPEGFTFARPVEVAVPVPADMDPADVSLWRMNPETGNAEFYSAAFDEVTRTVSAQTYVMSPWFITGHDPDANVSGCIHVSNTSLSSWLMICIDEVVLEYPDQDTWLAEGSGPLFAPIGTIGWSAEGNWYVPQGTYRLCLQRERESHPMEYEHIFMDNVVVTEPWRYNDPNCTNISNGSFASPDTGRCACIPTYTTSVGTGDIQVTLTWYNEDAIDLDLHVVDPTGEDCYFNNNPSSTGGVLDRDNACGNYVNGRPENTFWTESPPAGEYIVSVDWWSECGNDIASQSFTLRTVVGENIQTYYRTINADDFLEVVRFTISGNAATFAEGAGKTIRPNIPRTAKN